MDIDRIDIDELNLNDNIDQLDNLEPVNNTNMYTTVHKTPHNPISNDNLIEPLLQNNKELSESVGNYITLFIIIFFISLLFLQKRLVALFFKRFINTDNRFKVIIAQSISIALLSTYSVYYIG